MKRLLTYALLATALLFTAVNFTGCKTTPEDKMALYVADAYDLGELGTQVALAENPDYRLELEYTLAGLRALEAQPDQITLDSLTRVLQRLPIDKLQTAKTRLYITGGRLVLRRVFGDVKLVNLGSGKQIVTALANGMEAGLK